MKAFVYASNWGKELWAWDPEKKTNRFLGSYPYGIHGVMEYNPIHKVLVFGGKDSGDTGNRTFYRMDAGGKVEKLKPAPIAVSCREISKLLCDPVSGEFLVQESVSPSGGKVFAFHPVRDEWQEIPGLRFPAGLGLAVDTYGVLMFCTGDQVFVYKHKPVWSENGSQGQGKMNH
ncbi:MAG: hypothetical protein ACUVXJ_18805 [Phycisphaerae bacterium]